MIEAIADSKEELDTSILMMQAGNDIESDDIKLNDDDQTSDNEVSKSKLASKAKVDVDPDALRAHQEQILQRSRTIVPDEYPEGRVEQEPYGSRRLN